MQLSEQEREAVIDTIMGEARGEGYLGMAAVAKAIANRSEVRGISMAQAVNQNNQFDGASYSAKSKDSKEREVAELALEAVLAGEDPAQVGASDHFATNDTKTSWTEAFKDTAKTIGGHTFYSSPQALERAQYSSITATPQSKPDMAAMAMLGNAPTATNAFDAVLGTPQQNELRGRAAAVAGGPPATPESLLGYNFSNNTVRDQEIQPDLAGIIGRSVQALGPEYGFSITSGGQPATGIRGVDRVGSTRHDHGFAADGRLTVDGQGITPSQNFDLYTDLARQAGVQGAKGFGHYGWGVHIDNARPGVWGPSTTSRDLDPGIRDAFNEGKSVREAGLYSQTGPSAKPDLGGLGAVMGGIGATPATAYGPSFGATDFAAAPLGAEVASVGIAPSGYSDYGFAAPSAQAPSKEAVIDAYSQYASSRMGNMAPLDAPVDLAARPEVMGPSFNFDGVTAAPSAKPDKDEGKGKGGFGKFDKNDPNEMGALGKAAFAAGLMSNPAMAIGGLALSNAINGRALNAGMGLGLGNAIGGLGGLGGLGNLGNFTAESWAQGSPAGAGYAAAMGGGNFWDGYTSYTGGGNLNPESGRDFARAMAAEQAARSAQGLSTWGDAFSEAFGGLGGLGGGGSSSGGSGGGKGGSGGKGGGNKGDAGVGGADGGK